MATKNHIYFDVALYLIIPFFGFYTVKFGFSPIYLTFILSVLFLMLGSFSNMHSWSADNVTLVSVTLVFYAILSYFLTWNYSDRIPSAWINYIFSFVYCLATILVLRNSSRTFILNSAYYAITFSISLLAIELLVRLSNPVTPEELGHYGREDIFWYVYKSNSFMYPDSNSIGLFASCLFMFTLQLGRYYYRRVNVFLLPIFILVLGSISRAAIISTIVIYLYQLIESRKVRLLYLLALVIFGGLAFLYIIINDESVLSRFWIAGLVFQYLTDATILSLLFGVGPGNAEDILNVGTHLLPFTLLVETGVIGTFLFVVLWYSIYIKSHKMAGVLCLVFILNGFSFTSFAIPWFYAMSVILIFLSKGINFGKVTTNINSSASI